MTPSQLEHLRLLDAHLDRLLETASKRTPGKWKVCNGQKGMIIRLAKDKVGEPQDVCRVWNCSRKEGNAIFIASCAGNAEAGWRSTKAAIDTIHIMQRNRGDQGLVTETLDAVTEALTTQILAAWPLELITKHQ